MKEEDARRRDDKVAAKNREYERQFQKEMGREAREDRVREYMKVFLFFFEAIVIPYWTDVGLNSGADCWRSGDTGPDRSPARDIPVTGDGDQRLEIRSWSR